MTLLVGRFPDRREKDKATANIAAAVARAAAATVARAAAAAVAAAAAEATSCRRSDHLPSRAVIHYDDSKDVNGAKRGL